MGNPTLAADPKRSDKRSKDAMWKEVQSRHADAVKAAAAVIDAHVERHEFFYHRFSPRSRSLLEALRALERFGDDDETWPLKNYPALRDQLKLFFADGGYRDFVDKTESETRFRRIFFAEHALNNAKVRLRIAVFELLAWLATQSEGFAEHSRIASLLKSTDGSWSLLGKNTLSRLLGVGHDAPLEGLFDLSDMVMPSSYWQWWNETVKLANPTNQRALFICMAEVGSREGNGLGNSRDYLRNLKDNLQRCLTSDDDSLVDSFLSETRMERVLLILYNLLCMLLLIGPPQLGLANGEVLTYFLGLYLAGAWWVITFVHGSKYKAWRFNRLLWALCTRDFSKAEYTPNLPSVDVVLQDAKKSHVKEFARKYNIGVHHAEEWLESQEKLCAMVRLP